METNPAPRRTTRRADRYKQQTDVAPSTELMERTASPEASPVMIPEVPAAIPARAQTPPPPMERPASAPQRKAKRPQRKVSFRMPWGLTAGIIACCVALLLLFTAQALMSAYLTRQAQAREAAYQQVVDNHPLDYREWIEQYAAENNLRPAFVAAIILNESSFRTDAESSVGARGLMQLMPATAEWIAGKLDVTGYSFDRMYDAETNIRFGTWYLGYLAKMFRGDPVLVTSAYHAGQGEVTGWLSDPTMSEDGVTLEIANMQDGPTKTYAGRVTQAYGIYEALYYSDSAEDQTVSHVASALPDAASGAVR